MVQRGLDAYSSEDLMALVEGQKKEVPKGSRYDDLVGVICKNVERTTGWESRCDETAEIGQMVHDLRLSVSTGAVTAAGLMELSKSDFKATKPVRTYSGWFSDEYETVEDLRKVVPAETLRRLELTPDDGIYYSNLSYDWDDIPALDLGGAKMRAVYVIDPFKVTIPLRSLSRKALGDLVRVLAA